MERFYSLDGNLYTFVATTEELAEAVETISGYKPGLYKIFASNLDLVALTNQVLHSYPNLQEKEYNTKFYQITPSQVDQILTNLSTNYQFTAAPVMELITSQSDSEKIATLLDFTQHVSAYKQTPDGWIADQYRINRCLEGFTPALSQDNLHSYLVTNPAKELAGSFCLVETSQDIQLESISGKSQKYTTLAGFKFPWLMSAVLQVYRTNFGHKPLRFSSSKDAVVQMYDKCGISVSDKLKGVKIEVIK